MKQALQYANTQLSAARAAWFEFLRMPSVSADPAFNAPCRQAADWTAARLRTIGIENVRFLETAHHPIVYGDWLHAPGKPTVLIYGHYDVQPPDPLPQWISPPFEPTIRDGHVFARGATDNKGQLVAFLTAVEAWLRGAGALPLNVKFFIEGDEESGSAGIEAVERYQKEVASDAILIADSPWFDAQTPAIYHAMKGLAYFEVVVRGANRDVHSGTFGNLMPNPINALANVLGAMCPSQGRINIPGFYDAVVDLSAAERAAMARVPWDSEAIRREYGVAQLGVGEPEYTLLERSWGRPTMDINGIGGGYQGAGSKTVIPNEAFAKVSFRLVANQDCETVAQLFETELRRRLPAGITLEKLLVHNNANPVMTPVDDPFVQAGVAALREATGKAAIVARQPASIPIAINLKRYAHAAILLFGMGYPDDNFHSPNEHLEIAQFEQGITSCIHMLARIGAVRAG